MGAASVTTKKGTDERSRKGDIRLMTCDTPGEADTVITDLNALIDSCGLTPWYAARGGRVCLRPGKKGVRALWTQGVYFHTKENDRTPDPKGLIKIMERVREIAATAKEEI
jgi:hypothetical protein